MATLESVLVLVVAVVLPCGILLCAFLLLYLKYLKRQDANEISVYRRRAQERRQQREAQRHRETFSAGNDNNNIGTSNSRNDDDEESNSSINPIRKKRIERSFVFQTVKEESGRKKKKMVVKKKKSVEDIEAVHMTENGSTNTTTLRSIHTTASRNDEDAEEKDNENEKTAPCNDSVTEKDSVDGKISLEQALPDEECFSGQPSSRPSSFSVNSIRNVIQTSSKTSSTRQRYSKEECCICLQIYLPGEIICTPKTSKCDHVFHKDCLFEWMKTHDCCPLCRKDLIN